MGTCPRADGIGRRLHPLALEISFALALVLIFRREQKFQKAYRKELERLSGPRGGSEPLTTARDCSWSPEHRAKDRSIVNPSTTT